MSNGQIAELLAREAQDRAGILQKTLRRAARLAFLWPEEAAVLLAQGRPLTELPGIGLGFIELGLAAALKARIPPERIVNFMSREELVAWSDTLREATVSSIST